MKPPKVLEKRYATISDFNNAISSTIRNTYPPTTRAIDVLTGPFESFTNLPARTLNYLYKEKKPVTYKKLYQLAIAEYEFKHVDYLLKKWLPESLLVASWREKGETVFQWIEQTEEEYARRLDDRQWFESLPDGKGK